MTTQEKHASSPDTGSLASPRLRFGHFEVDAHSGELRKRGMRLRIQEKPLQALLLLLKNAGKVVHREDLRQALWPGDAFGDFEHGLNLTINRLRSTLGDRADNPRFVETVPRRGYRFIAPVETLTLPGQEVAGNGRQATGRTAATPSGPDGAASAPLPVRSAAGGRRVGVIASLLALVTIAFLISSARRPSADVAAPAMAAERVVLLVLPFKDLSPEPLDFLSQGLTTEMITRLGRVDPRRLGVIAFTTALQYQGTTQPLREIARELDAQYVIEGSLTQDDVRLRVNVQLIKAEDQTQLLSESFDREAADLLALQRSVSDRVMTSLAGEILGLTTPHPAAEIAPQPAAYRAFLQGLYLWNQRSEEGLRQAATAFEQAVTLDPDYARAYEGLGKTLALFPTYGLEMPNDAMPQARRAALRALELDPTLAGAHATLAWIRWGYEWDFEEARVSFLTALQLNANHATAHQWYAGLLTSVEEFDAARAAMRLAAELDPKSQIISTGLAWVEYYAGNYHRTVDLCLQAIERNPDFHFAQKLLSDAYTQMGAYREALDWLQKHLEVEPRPALQADLAYLLALSGDRSGAQAILENLMSMGDPTEYVPPYRIAFAYGALGEEEAGLKWLQRAFAGRASEMALARVDPRLDPLRDYSRFQEIIAQIGS